MNRSVAVRLGLVIAGLLMAGSAFAQAPNNDGMGRGPGFGEHHPPLQKAFEGRGIQGRWWNNPKVAEKLKLTDEQRKDFDKVLFEHKEKLIDLRGNVEKAELEMEPLMRDDQPNEAKILAQIDKVAQARAELEKAHARFLLAIRGKLTPEQWKQVQAMRASHEDERGQWRRDGRRPGRMERHMPPPPPGGPQAPGPHGGTDAAPGPDAPRNPGSGAE